MTTRFRFIKGWVGNDHEPIESQRMRMTTVQRHVEARNEAMKPAGRGFAPSTGDGRCWLPAVRANDENMPA
jgi:hypothetical protein